MDFDGALSHEDITKVINVQERIVSTDLITYSSVWVYLLTTKNQPALEADLAKYFSKEDGIQRAENANLYIKDNCCRVPICSVVDGFVGCQNRE